MEKREFSPIIVLGSTGSVGVQTMDIAACHSLRVEGIAGGKNTAVLEEQIRRFRPAYCAVDNEDAARSLSVSCADTDTKILPGREGVLFLAGEGKAPLLYNSITGTAGLMPTLTAIRSGKNIALANKETLVTAGDIVMSEAQKYGVSILPVDSEHCAIFQCLQGNPQRAVRRLFLTCSGGAFYGKKREELSHVTRAEALAHPTWKMGPKITVDCASLMNKGLELIEAVRLFRVSPEQIQVVIHRESIVHSAVEYEDSAVIAQLSVPDMRLCIQYALTYPERLPSPVAPLDLFAHSPLTFAPPDEETFTLLPLAREAVKTGGTLPATLNGANEAAVALFLQDRIRFTDIFDLVTDTVHSAKVIQNPTLDDLTEADSTARESVRTSLRT